MRSGDIGPGGSPKSCASPHCRRSRWRGGSSGAAACAKRTTSRTRVCRLDVERSTKQYAFLGRNHGREILNAETRKEFSASIQSVSLVGAVGIEPTTSPV